MDPRLANNSFDAKVSSVTTANIVTAALHPKIAEGDPLIHCRTTCLFDSSAISDGSQGGLGPESSRSTQVHKRQIIPP